MRYAGTARAGKFYGVKVPQMLMLCAGERGDGFHGAIIKEDGVILLYLTTATAT